MLRLLNELQTSLLLSTTPQYRGTHILCNSIPRFLTNLWESGYENNDGRRKHETLKAQFLPAYRAFPLPSGVRAFLSRKASVFSLSLSRPKTLKVPLLENVPLRPILPSNLLLRKILSPNVPISSILEICPEIVLCLRMCP